jgi:hypothetical protein
MGELKFYYLWLTLSISNAFNPVDHAYAVLLFVIELQGTIAYNPVSLFKI